jgi:hypothetical protein
MAGWLSNGVQTVGAPIQNGVTIQVPAMTNNGVAQTGGVQPTYAQLSSLAEVSADTETAAGAQPQTVAAFAAQIAMIACAMVKNTQTSTAGAATSNTLSGQIVTEALTTAAGATYTMTLTNSLIAATAAAGVYSNIIFDIRSVTNTKTGMVPASSTAGSGSTVLTFTNTGTAALNGTMIIAWHLAP